MSTKNCGGCLPVSTRSRHSQGFTCDQNFERIELRAGVEHQNIDALARQVPRCHSPDGAAADDDDVMDGLLALTLHLA